MKIALTLLLSIFIGLPSAALAASGKYQEAKQVELDQACEKARQKKLTPERDKYIKECVDKKQKPDRAACERFYADYGNQAGNRAPLYYDLPECEKAFEYRKGKSR